MMVNRWIVKGRTPQEAMILGILGNHQKNPNQAVKRGHQRAQVVPQKKRLA
jgi:hypothetical protein